MGDGELVDDEHAAAAQRVEEHHTHHGLPADGRTRVNTDGGKRIRSILGDAGLVWCVGRAHLGEVAQCVGKFHKRTLGHAGETQP